MTVFYVTASVALYVGNFLYLLFVSCASEYELPPLFFFGAFGTYHQITPAHGVHVGGRLNFY